MKKTRKENICVVVDPSTYSGEKEDSILKTAEFIAQGIKRHVDDVQYVSIEYDTVHYCEFCDETWEVITTEDVEKYPDDPYAVEGMPICCGKAQDEFLENLRKEREKDAMMS